MSAHLIYAVLGVFLMMLGLRAALLRASTIDRLLGVNVMGAGIFLLLITAAYRGPDLPPDPVPHALVLTGIVVAVSATALGLALSRALSRRAADVEKDEHGR